MPKLGASVPRKTVIKITTLLQSAEKTRHLSGTRALWDNGGRPADTQQGGI